MSHETKTIQITMLLDPALFRQQRGVLQGIIDNASHKLMSSQVETLEGLQNLCDEIADQAKDNYGLNTTTEYPDPLDTETEGTTA